MDVNNKELEDGDPLQTIDDAPSIVELPKQKLEGTLNKKKRRRGKSKRKIMKPFMKIPWQDRRKNDKSKRNNRFRKIVLSKTHAPFNNNQFLMEIHKPEPENNFHGRTPSARTRDSSFSVDSEDNYFFSLPEDEEEYLTKEFSSVYEDAQSERLSNMTKNDLIQEYLLLEAKYDNLVKRTERSKFRPIDEDKGNSTAERDTSTTTDKDSMLTDRDTSATSIQSSAVEDSSIDEVMKRVKEQDEQIHELQLANEKLRVENEHLRQRSTVSSSEDSESDSSSTSVSSSSSSHTMSPTQEPQNEVNGEISVENSLTNGQNGVSDDLEAVYPLVNGFHDCSE